MDKWIEEEITLSEFSERFIGNNDFKTPDVYDMSGFGIEVLTESDDGSIVYKPIKSFVVKPEVSEYYTDGNIKVTDEHRFIVRDIDGKFVNVYARDMDGFECINEPMNVVDIEVEDEHSYLANGHLNHNTTSGGKALGFHASVRLRLKSIGKIKKKTSVGDTIIGVQTRAIVVKNRLGPPQREADFDIYFDRGIDDYSSWLKTMKAHNLVKTAGAWYTYTEVDIETGEVGEDHKFQAKDFNEMLENNPLLRENMYGRICDAVIMRYRSDEVDIDNTEIEETDE